MKKRGVADKWEIGLLVLLATAVILVVAIVAVNVVRRSEIGVVEQGSGINMEEVREKVFAAEDLDSKINIYQEYIDMADLDEKVELYNERIQTILQLDYDNRQYARQIIDDTVEIDDILQSVSSAAQVINMASEYNDHELVTKYVGILREREIAEGVDVENVEGRG